MIVLYTTNVFYLGDPGCTHIHGDSHTIRLVCKCASTLPLALFPEKVINDREVQSILRSGKELREIKVTPLMKFVLNEIFEL